ncbi:unnamed protein product, partial [Mesorhabditis spiculigera]
MTLPPGVSSVLEAETPPPSTSSQNRCSSSSHDCADCARKDDLIDELKAIVLKPSRSNCANCEILTLENKTALATIQGYKTTVAAAEGAKAECDYLLERQSGAERCGWNSYNNLVIENNNYRTETAKLREQVAALTGSKETSNNNTSHDQKLRIMCLLRDTNLILQHEIAETRDELAKLGFTLAYSQRLGPPPKKRKAED